MLENETKEVKDNVIVPNFNLIADIPQRVTAVIGERILTTKEISGMGEGSIVELKQLIGEPIELRANDIPIALGEVIAIDENFGVRVTDVLTQEQQRERMRYGSRKFLSDVIVKKS